MKLCHKGRYPDRDSNRALPDKSRELPLIYRKQMHVFFLCGVSARLKGHSLPVASVLRQLSVYS
jgi:hypothetical protein